MNKITWPVLGITLLLKLLLVFPSYADNFSAPPAGGLVFPVIKEKPSDPLNNGWTGNRVGVNSGHSARQVFLQIPPILNPRLDNNDKRRTEIGDATTWSRQLENCTGNQCDLTGFFIRLVQVIDTPLSASNKSITRQIEGFTLGMSLDEAKHVINQDDYNWDGKSNNSQQFFTNTSKFCIKTKYRPKYELLNMYCEYLPVVSSVSLWTKTSSSIELVFYQAKLYKIVIYPLAKKEVIEKSLWQKYGQPKDREYLKGGSLELSQTWYDGKTKLRFQKDSNCLQYSDIELEKAANQEVERNFYKREEERLKKENTLPKGY